MATMSIEAAFSLGVFVTLLAGVGAWTAFRCGYRHARRLAELGVDLRRYEPRPLLFERQEDRTAPGRLMVETPR